MTATPRFLLDTNILSDMVKHPTGKAAEKIASVGESALGATMEMQPPEQQANVQARGVLTKHMFGHLWTVITYATFALAAECATIDTHFTAEPGLDAFRPGSTREQVELQLGKPISSVQHRNGGQTDIYYDHPVEYRRDPHKMVNIRSRYDLLRLKGNPIFSVAHPDGTQTDYHGDDPTAQPIPELDAERAAFRAAFQRMMDEYVSGWWGTVVKPTEGETGYLTAVVYPPGDKEFQMTGAPTLPAWDIVPTVPGKKFVAITYGRDGRVRVITRAPTGPARGVPSAVPTFTVTGTIEVGKSPTGLAIAPDDRFVYIANYESGTVSALDTASSAVADLLRLPGRPHGVAITPDGTRAYVTDFASGTIVAVSVATKEVTATVRVGSSPIRVAITPDGRRAYVTNFHSQNVSVIDTTNHTVTSTISVGTYPFAVAVTPDGRWVYVTNAGSDSVSVIDAASNRISTTIRVGKRPAGLAITPNGTRAYVANGESNTVSIIDTGTNRVINSIEVGWEPGGVAITADGSRAYVAYASGNAVAVIDTISQRVIANMSVGSAPQEIALTRDGRRAYVSNARSGTVSVLDLAGAPAR